MSDLDVLLVDDEKEFVVALAERLAMRRLSTRIAFSGEEALELVGQKAPDVVVLDLKMPGMNGLDVLRLLKKSHPQVPVIMLTAHGSERDREAGKLLGAFDQLQKPVEIGALIRSMKEACGHRRTRPEADNGVPHRPVQ